MIVKNILECVGRTPLVEISAKTNLGGARILAKLERMNPGGSAKDRVALHMIDVFEAEGKLKPGMTIIEPTSGNTGVGLAMVAAVRGYHLILTMPDTMSIERRRLAGAYGVEVVLTEGALGMQGAIDKAESLAKERNGIVMGQFVNESNSESHYLTTGPEIWEDTNGTVDALVVAVGTGGTITGTAKYLLEKNPQIKIVGVEPDTSAVLSGGKAGPHLLQGIGAGFIPKILDTSIISEVIPVSATASGAASRALASQEGILSGITSGSALAAALKLSERADFYGKTIVVILPDTGERYLSTWLFEPIFGS